MDRLLLSEKDQMQLLGRLCVGLGFCSLTPECRSRLAATPLTIDEFADAVLRGVGIGEGRALWKHELKLRQQVQQVVKKYYDQTLKHHP